MDYKYIEQLLERYWECDTSVEEELILRTFFSQKELPTHLVRYQNLFVYEQQQSELTLGKDFDERLLQAIGAKETTAKPAPVVKIKRISLTNRIRPLYRAAAAVAIVTLLGNAAQHSFTTAGQTDSATWDYNQSAYQDSYKDPQKAYEMGMKALEMFKEGPQTAVADSARMKDVKPGIDKGK